MSLLMMQGLGGGYPGVTAAANPQINYFENFPGMDFGQTVPLNSNGTLSFHEVNVPLSLSFNNVVFLISNGNTSNKSWTYQFGLYSLNGSTLSIANSASRTSSYNATTLEWLSMVTSATQNISPGQWYFAFNALSGGNSVLSIMGNSSINPGNAEPVMIKGRMTASTNAMPASIATSDLDITGSDAVRNNYIVITA